jgi:hypothetical protein
MNRQVCPFHTGEDIAGVRVNDEGAYAFTCDRVGGHPTPGPHTWMQLDEPAGLPEMSGLAEELGLQLELPAAITNYPGQWVEYGVVEAAYADANPQDFGRLVERYSHTAIAPTQYSASAFLAATLGRLSRTGHVLFRPGPATGRWNYNVTISWWTLAPEPDWESRTAWADLDRTMDYVPGNTE